MTRDYVEVQYNPSIRPITSYPEKLASYLAKRHQLEKSSLLLEIGAGRPDVLIGFKKIGMLVNACDISEVSQIACSAAEIPFEFTDLFVGSLPYEDNSFEIVYSKSVIEHMPNPGKFFEEAYRVLAPGGKILTLTPDWEANFKTFFDDPTHVRPMTRRSMELSLRIAGFVNVEAYRFRQLPWTWNSKLGSAVAAITGRFVPSRTRKSPFRWTRELMLVGYATKPIT
jgi:SAM-dependent methyltransferase